MGRRHCVMYLVKRSSHGPLENMITYFPLL
uniref:Uncharacterized protein n=1 Tax=Arundo donax TaxID=35708 RepID=A0A0A9AEB8_ARUDO